MNKRPYGGGSGEPQHSSKKQKKVDQTISTSHYEDAVAQLPPPVAKVGYIPSYTHFTVANGLPPLPAVKDGALSTAPFRHKSTIKYDRTAMSADVSYERLEFLGDAQLEHIASRLIYERFGHLTTGQQSQLRELLVKNETLAEYAKAYGFDQRIEISDMQRMQDHAKDRGNKGFNKVLGDVFEAYIAAVVLSDAEDGFAVAEKWMTQLWAPKLLEAAAQDRIYAASLRIHTDRAADPCAVYDPAAKADLQKRIMGGDTKLSYEPYRDTVELKGDQLGQNRHYIALYLTGYGYERKLLGKGEGKNKVEAGNWAATQAMHGENGGIVEDCEERLKIIKAKRRAEREAAEKERA